MLVVVSLAAAGPDATTLGKLLDVSDRAAVDVDSIGSVYSRVSVQLELYETPAAGLDTRVLLVLLSVGTLL